MKRVSIIIPVYNVEPYIEECLRSVEEQTVANDIECIIVDDRGTDNSIAIAQEWVKGYGLRGRDGIDFRIITREKNGGLSAARNTGIREATGEYLYFLDSDDYLIPNAIETLLTLADKHGGVDLLPALYITDKGHEMPQFGAHSFPEFSDDQHLIKRALLDYDRIPVTAANRLVRRELILEHNLFFKEGIIHEDNYWTFFLAKHVKRMAYCPDKIYYYRTTEGSITKKVNVEKESFAFKTMITDFSNNIDDFEKGAQMALILNTLIIANNSGYYEKSDADKERLISLFSKQNRIVERLLLRLFLHTNNSKILHLLIRLYNL